MAIIYHNATIQGTGAHRSGDVKSQKLPLSDKSETACTCIVGLLTLLRNNGTVHL